MDQALVDLSIEYHGPTLIDQLAAEQVNVRLPNFLSFVNKGNSMDTPRDEAFQERVSKLIARKSDLLFSDPKCVAPFLDHRNTDYYAELPPLEAFLDIPGAERKKHFYQCVEKGDIVIGMVSGVQDNGLNINLLCMDEGKARDIDQLKISVFCPVREIPRSFSHDDPLEHFTIKDKVRGAVLSFNTDKELIVISLQKKALLSHLGHLKLGLINDEDLPLHFRQLQDVGSCTYHQHLERNLDFHNPTNVATLSSKMKLLNKLSLTRGLHSMNHSEEEKAERLRRKQSYRWALKSVSEGISHFKEGRQVEAMQYLNKALQIDDENVEALVARGALYANNESYLKAIEDFAEALRLNPGHNNAKKYMCETLVAQGRRLFESESYSEAKEYIEKALRSNPGMVEAQDLLGQIEKAKSQPTIPQTKGPHPLSPETKSLQRADRVEKEENAHHVGVLTKTKETLRKIMEDEKAQRSSRKVESARAEESSSNSSSSSSSSDSSSSSGSESSSSDSTLSRSSLKGQGQSKVKATRSGRDAIDSRRDRYIGPVDHSPRSPPDDGRGSPEPRRKSRRSVHENSPPHREDRPPYERRISGKRSLSPKPGNASGTTRSPDASVRGDRYVISRRSRSRSLSRGDYQSRKKSPYRGQGPARSKSPFRGQGRSRSKSPYGRKARSRSKSPHRGRVRSRSKSPYKGQSRYMSKSPYKGQGRYRSKSPYRRKARSRSKSPHRDQTRFKSQNRGQGRSRSPYRGQSKSKSTENKNIRESSEHGLVQYELSPQASVNSEESSSPPRNRGNRDDRRHPYGCHGRRNSSPSRMISRSVMVSPFGRNKLGGTDKPGVTGKIDDSKWSRHSASNLPDLVRDTNSNNSKQPVQISSIPPQSMKVLKSIESDLRQSAVISKSDTTGKHYLDKSRASRPPGGGHLKSSSFSGDCTRKSDSNRDSGKSKRHRSTSSSSTSSSSSSNSSSRAPPANRKRSSSGFSKSSLSQSSSKLPREKAFTDNSARRKSIAVVPDKSEREKKAALDEMEEFLVMLKKTKKEQTAPSK